MSPQRPSGAPPPGSEPPSVVIVDDHALFRAGVRAELGEMVRVLGDAETVEDATETFQQAQELLFEDLPAIPLWYSNVTGVYGDTVDNVEFGWNSVPLYYEVTKN